MSLTPLNAISPIDGRYRSKTVELAAFFSEEALIKYRVLVEVEYFIALCEHPLKRYTIFPKYRLKKMLTLEIERTLLSSHQYNTK